VTKNQQVLISTREAATLLESDPRTIQRKAAAGLLPYVQKMPGAKGAYIFDETTLREIKALAEGEASR
jgi:hypothetical protein